MSEEKLDVFGDLRDALMREGACDSHGPLRVSETIEEAALWSETVERCAPHNRIEHLRWLARNDLYFLLVYVLNCKFLTIVEQPQWYFDRCSEVQLLDINYLAFWSRKGGKSVIITFGQTIQDILKDPNQTFGIFSHTRPIAKQFLRQIKFEFENNELLKELFPDVLYGDPRKESPKWSEDDGIVVKRTSNPKESTVEAHGLTDGQPTSKHFTKLLYDDVIDEKAVTSSEMIDKVTKAWELSLNLAATDPIQFRVAGTFYAEGDTYSTMIDRGFGHVLIRPIIVGGKSLLLSDKGIAQLKQSMSPSTFAMQILLDPKQADKERGFKAEWLRHWKTPPAMQSMNRYIFVDPGGKGEESSSYTAMVVVALGADRHKYVLDIIKDRLSFVQRIDALFELHRKYQPLSVYYERYSMQADVEGVRERMEHENYRFNLTEVGALSGSLSKDRRIEKLQPDFANGKILLPPFGTLKRTLHDGRQIDLVENFVNKEYNAFPYSREKDVLDALARLHDPRVILTYPRAWGTTSAGSRAWGQPGDVSGGWMSE